MTSQPDPFSSYGVAPYQLVAAPMALYVAAPATAAPTLAAATGLATLDSAVWTLVGTSGMLDYTSAVEVAFNQKTTALRGEGTTMVRKYVRDEEDWMFSVELQDTSLEQVMLALNKNTVTTVAATTGVIGTKKIQIERGFDVANWAVCGVALSPYGAFEALFYMPRAAQTEQSKAQFSKSTSAKIKLAFSSIAEVTLAVGLRQGFIQATSAAAA